HQQSLLFRRNSGETLGFFDPLAGVTDALLHTTPDPFPRVFTVNNSKRITFSGDVCLTEFHERNFQPERHIRSLSPASSNSSSPSSSATSYNSLLDTPISPPSFPILTCLPQDDDKDRPTTGSPADIFSGFILQSSSSTVGTTVDDDVEASNSIITLDLHPSMPLSHPEPTVISRHALRPRRARDNKPASAPTKRVAASDNGKTSVSRPVRISAGKSTSLSSSRNVQPTPTTVSTTIRSHSPTSTNRHSPSILPEGSTSSASSPLIDVADLPSIRPSRPAKRKIGSMKEGDDVDESSGSEVPAASEFEDNDNDDSDQDLDDEDADSDDDDDDNSENDGQPGPSRKKAQGGMAPASGSMQPLQIAARGKYRFKCAVAGCNDRFTRKHDAERHMKTVHSSDKGYPCSSCGKVLSRLDACRRHEQQQHGLHTNEKAASTSSHKRKRG
ncbi:hypothetical protein D9758_018336, partial [Tetrapyrgos nigripes]